MAKKIFRVLALDGGGIRGLYSAELLKELSIKFARLHGDLGDQRLDIGKYFDLIVGTSTGAILGTALAAGIDIDRIIKLYTDHAKHIFKHQSAPNNFTYKVYSFFRMLFSSLNTSENLKEVLCSIYGEKTLEQLYRDRGIALCVASVNAETYLQWVFKTPHSTRLTRDNNYTLVDICLSSSAAPIVFPLHGIKKPENNDITNWFMDGGVCANNPTLIGLLEAIELAPEDAEIQVLSIGTCPVDEIQSISNNKNKKGIFSWLGGIKIIDASMRAQANAVHHMAKFLSSSSRLKNIRYLRLDDVDISPSDKHYFQLDNPDATGLKKIMKYAAQAADNNYSLATTGTRTHQLLCEIFSEIKPFSIKGR